MLLRKGRKGGVQRGRSEGLGGRVRGAETGFSLQGQSRKEYSPDRSARGPPSTPSSVSKTELEALPRKSKRTEIRNRLIDRAPRAFFPEGPDSKYFMLCGNGGFCFLF